MTVRAPEAEPSAARTLTDDAMMRPLPTPALCALCALLLAGGCALPWRGDDAATPIAPTRASAPAEDVIARDFLDAFVQLDGYSPERTAVRFARDALADDPLLEALATRMREAGYAVGVVGESAPGTVTHDVETMPDGAVGDVHTLSIGAVQLRRRYVERAPGEWRPAGSLFVRGADASGIRLDGEESGDGRPPAVDEAPPAPAPRARPGAGESLADADAAPSAGRPAAIVSAVPSRADVPPVALAAPRRTAPPLGFDERSGRPVYSGLVAPTIERGVGAPPRNIMELGDSNFTDLFEDFGNVDELVLTFANDSLVLGDRNKRLVRRAVERFDPESDLFSIVGCSLGPTSIPNGNEALALGRANRVQEELLFAGVPRERIRNEGCWAGEASVKFPTRGVVLTHLRRPS